MLLDNKTASIQSLSDTYHVSRDVIKKDLKEIEDWLETFHLRVESKKKIGIHLIGDEKNKRAALLRIDRFGNSSIRKNNTETIFGKLFSSYETIEAKRTVKNIEKELDKEFTNESLNNIVSHLLITVKRIKGRKNVLIADSEKEKLKTKKRI